MVRACLDGAPHQFAPKLDTSGSDSVRNLSPAQPSGSPSPVSSFHHKSSEAHQSRGRGSWTSVDSVNTPHVVLFRWVSEAAAPVGVLVPLFTLGLGWNGFMSRVTCVVTLT